MLKNLRSCGFVETMGLLTYPLYFDNQTRRRFHINAMFREICDLWVDSICIKSMYTENKFRPAVFEGRFWKGFSFSPFFFTCVMLFLVTSVPRKLIYGNWRILLTYNLNHDV
jgi:hypothetical protein